MEYWREPGNIIQADFALRAGRLLAQYPALTEALPAEETYDATLTICVLQSLLTYCTELFAVMRRHRKSDFTPPITDVPNQWGFTQSQIKENTFPGPFVTSEHVLVHMRDALSHPTASEGTEYPPTGYTSIPDVSKRVTGFRFTNSPWVKKRRLFKKSDRVWMAVSRNREDVQKTIDSFHNEYGGAGYLEVLARDDGRFGIAHRGYEYLPVFVIELRLPQLAELARRLANYLAQATNDQWDGKSIQPLVA